MARSNKYASLNFNDIYERKIIDNPNKKQNSSSASASLTSPNKTILSNSRIHGNMLVLSRPSPKPISLPSPRQPSPGHQHPIPLTASDQARFPQPSPPSPSPSPRQQHLSPITAPDQARFQPDSISLRPLGRTGTGLSLPSSPITTSLQSKDKDSPVSPKPDRFVPPHLRPGFLGREEKPDPVSVGPARVPVDDLD